MSSTVPTPPSLAGRTLRRVASTLRDLKRPCRSGTGVARRTRSLKIRRVRRSSRRALRAVLAWRAESAIEANDGLRRKDLSVGDGAVLDMEWREGVAVEEMESPRTGGGRGKSISVLDRDVAREELA